MQNIIFIVADAMRADRLSKTGYRRRGKKLTPNIDKLAEEGVYYEKAYSPGPWTKVAQPALMTGIYSSKMNYPGKGNPLDSEFSTIGEYFQEEGFETRAWNYAPYIRSSKNFDRGFDYYEDVSKKDRIEPDFWHMEGMFWNLLFGQDNRTRYGLKGIKRWLRSRSDEKPFFLFWNPVNPHNKYDAPRKFADRFEREVEEEMNEEAIDKASDWGQFDEYMTGEEDLTEEEMDVVKSRYDAEIAYLDHRIGQLVDFLKNKGIYDDTVIAFTSDHGENFGDFNRLLYHGYGINEDLIRVPLVINKSNGFEEIEKPVSTIDIFNSTYKYSTGNEINGIDSKPSLLEGEEKRDIILCERDKTGEKDYLSENKEKLPVSYEWYLSGKKAAIKQDEKLVKTSEGETEKWDISTSPEEKKDNLENEKELENKINELGPHERKGSDEIENKKVKEQLEKLGYNT